MFIEHFFPSLCYVLEIHWLVKPDPVPVLRGACSSGGWWGETLIKYSHGQMDTHSKEEAPGRPWARQRAGRVFLGSSDADMI